MKEGAWINLFAGFVVGLFSLVLVSASLAWTSLTCLLQGWVLVRLWEWFITPGFNAPRLTWPAAVGVVFIVHYLTWQPDLGVKEKMNHWSLVLAQLWGPLLTLFLGYLLHLVTEGR